MGSKGPKDILFPTNLTQIQSIRINIVDTPQISIGGHPFQFHKNGMVLQ